MAKKGRGGVLFRNYRWVWWIVFSPFLFLVALIGMAKLGLLGEMPSTIGLEDPRRNLASVVYSEDGEILGKYYLENRNPVSYDQISKHVIDALIATEDVRFYDHSGIDPRGTLRAIFFLGSEGGASTLSQQLAKLLFSKKPSNRIERGLQKVKEWVIAVELEKRYTKEEIIAMYLNQADYGHNIFGISSAAKIYYNKKPIDLTVAEAATLVGLLKGPTLYSPLRNYNKGTLQRAVDRRNTVLDQMKKYGKLSETDFQKFRKEPIIEDFEKLRERVYQNSTGSAGTTQYFLEELKKDVQAWCNEHINPRTKEKYNIYKDGLRIYTTIDSRIQKHAEQAVKEYMPRLQKRFFETKKGKKNAPFASNMDKKEVDKIIMNSIKTSDGYKALKSENMSEAEIMKVFNTPKEMTIFSWNGPVDTMMTPRDSVIYHQYFLMNGVLCMDAHTGEIKAWSGGINFEYFKYDHVRAGKYDKSKKMVFPGGGRQVGSTFKPFVYAMAMMDGRSPCELIPNTRVCIESGGKEWCPDNSDAYRNEEMVTMKDALAHSINYASAYLMKQYNPQSVIKFIQQLGITAPMEPNPSICLGTPDISVYEMVAAYCTFFNKGIYNRPIFLTRIEDRNGNTLAEFYSESNEVMNEKAAYLVVELLRGVILDGTSKRLRTTYGFEAPVGGKTGTTQSNSDGWFIGGTPDLVCGVWTGAEDRTVRFTSTKDGQGANMALPIWGLFMKKVYQDPRIKINRGDFERPTEMEGMDFECIPYEE